MLGPRMGQNVFNTTKPWERVDRAIDFERSAGLVAVFYVVCHWRDLFGGRIHQLDKGVIGRASTDDRSSMQFGSVRKPHPRARGCRQNAIYRNISVHLAAVVFGTLA